MKFKNEKTVLKTPTMIVKFANVIQPYMDKYKIEVTLPEDLEETKEFCRILDELTDAAWDEFQASEEVDDEAKEEARKQKPYKAEKGYDKETKKKTKENTGNLTFNFDTKTMFGDKENKVPLFNCDGQRISHSQFKYDIPYGSKVIAQISVNKYYFPATGKVGVSKKLQGLQIVEAGGDQGACSFDAVEGTFVGSEVDPEDVVVATPANTDF